MRNILVKSGLAAALVAWAALGWAQTPESVVDIPTRPGVTQRMVVVRPAAPKAAVVLLAGGHGGLQIFRNGSFKWGDDNFLVRTRHLFAEQGLLVAVVDAPSDRQSPPYLGGFRQKPEHAADLKAVIAWMRAQAAVPALMAKLGHAPRKALLSFTGGYDEGQPCLARAHHGFNGIEREVVAQTAAWILNP